MPPSKFSHSSLSTWRRCRYKYFLTYIKNYVGPSSAGQQRGTIGHTALGEWYNTGGDDEAALKKASDLTTNIELETGLDLSKDWQDLQFVLLRYFNWARQNDNFEVIAVEQEYTIDIGGIELGGFIDGIVDQKGYKWILEHKFNKQASTDHIGLDMQVSIYMLAAQRLGYNPSGCMYNVIRMTQGGIAEREPVLRKLAYRNNEGLKVIEYELQNQMHELKRFNEEGPAFMKVYRNPTKDCHWDCPFYNACLSLNDSGEADSVLERFKINDKYSKKGEIDNE